jgi:hypothetical protein
MSDQITGIFGDGVSLVRASLADLGHEREIRPSLLNVLDHFPPLLADYLKLDELDRQKLKKFNDYYYAYLLGHGTGECIQFFRSSPDLMGSYGLESPAFLAQDCRSAYQLEAIFLHYLEHDLEKRPFDQGYVRSCNRVKDMPPNVGANLLIRLRKNFQNLDHLLPIVASAQLELPPKYKGEKKIASPICLFC